MTVGFAKSGFGAVAIGRNEGERLRQCLLSLSKATWVVYVDSGSTDGSLTLARELGVPVVELDLSTPFTAARARNAGFRRLKEIAPDIIYIQFVDGDCELADDWPFQAISFLESHSEVCAVLGRRRERFPDRSIYNKICDIEWNMPIGEVRSCGGDVMIRASSLEIVNGFRDNLIAGEEPELCVRLRAAGWRIWRLDLEMTLHDAAMVHFGQWWRRNIRSGYAFAQGAFLHGAPPERHWVWESRRAQFWGIWLPAVLLVAQALFGPLALLGWLIYPIQIVRRTIVISGPLYFRAQLAFFELLARFPEGIGQIRFIRDRVFRRNARLIEYK